MKSSSEASHWQSQVRVVVRVIATEKSSLYHGHVSAWLIKQVVPTMATGLHRGQTSHYTHDSPSHRSAPVKPRYTIHDIVRLWHGGVVTPVGITTLLHRGITTLLHEGIATIWNWAILTLLPMTITFLYYICVRMSVCLFISLSVSKISSLPAIILMSCAKFQIGFSPKEMEWGWSTWPTVVWKKAPICSMLLNDLHEAFFAAEFLHHMPQPLVLVAAVCRGCQKPS